MQVSFNPSIKYSSASFKSNNKKLSNTKLTKEEIATTKIKKSISELKYIVIGIGIIYFAMKRTLKHNRINNIVKAAERKTKMAAPEQMKSLLINKSPFSII